MEQEDVMRLLRELEGENERLRAALDTAKLVGRAKCALVLHAGMSEETAHRYIEKRAMDRRVSNREIALEILDMYGP